MVKGTLFAALLAFAVTSSGNCQAGPLSLGLTVGEAGFSRASSTGFGTGLELADRFDADWSWGGYLQYSSYSETSYLLVPAGTASDPVPLAYHPVYHLGLELIRHGSGQLPGLHFDVRLGIVRARLEESSYRAETSDLHFSSGVFLGYDFPLGESVRVGPALGWMFAPFDYGGSVRLMALKLTVPL
jgi:hypothetical protein